MVKKKVSGQTVAIIILTILLLLTIGFGGVYSYYTARSNKISGKIEMGNLQIQLTGQSGESGKSEIVISNGTNIVPGQRLENSALSIDNKSSTNIYLIVVYEIRAVKMQDSAVINDKHQGAVLDIDVEYINPLNESCSSNIGVSNREWIDYVFEADPNDENARDAVLLSDETQTKKVYRCLVSTGDYAPVDASGEPITVIGENKMSLSGDMGNDYQSTSIVFTFQAYAISSNIDFGLTAQSTKADRCEAIVNAIYFSQGKTFFNLG